MKRSRRWIQSAVRAETRRALHRMLRIPEDETIPRAKLREAVEHQERFFRTFSAQELLRRRAQFAINVRGIGLGGRR